jgi:rhodanese-related sulfurtransferase
MLKILPNQLNDLIGRAHRPLILDTRRELKFLESDRIICGAIRLLPEHVERFAQSQNPAQALVYCVYGHNVSEEAVATLNQLGWQASALAGGIEGGQTGVDSAADQAHWKSQGLFTIKKRPDWGVTGEQPSRWITRSRPKIDRIACPWLISRFIDARAEFFYVPSETVFSEAKKLNAVPYDIDGAPVSHVADQCSFDALLAGFDLHVPALNLLATIIRGADTHCLDLAPQAAGLLAISRGMSTIHQDDHAMLAAMMPVYDALYVWCQQSLKGSAI